MEMDSDVAAKARQRNYDGPTRIASEWEAEAASTGRAWEHYTHAILASGMELGIQLAVWYTDADLIQLRPLVWNGEFGGAAKPYVGIGRLEEAAGLLSGFPRDSVGRPRSYLGSIWSGNRGWRHPHALFLH
jgi:hypothetical protein